MGSIWKEKAKLYGQIGEEVVGVGIGTVAKTPIIRRITVLGAVGTVGAGTAMVLGATGVVVKSIFVVSAGALVGGFIAGMRAGFKEGLVSD